MPSDKVIQHVPADGAGGAGGGSVFSAVFACLHTGIIYHNISLRARLLIISFCVGAAGNGIIQVSGNFENPWMHVRVADAKKGEWAMEPLWRKQL